MGKVVIKGKNFLGFEIEVTEENIERIAKELNLMLASSSHLLKNAIITLKLTEKNKQFADEIVRLLSEKEIQINAIVVENRNGFTSALPIIETKNINLLEEQNEKQVATYRGNLRSGQVIRVNGDVVVIGNANANSYIYATGNIFVLGKLNGIPHAGYGGDTSSIIFALGGMNPPQIRIGDLITRSPEDSHPEKASSYTAEIAFVNKGNIVITPYSEWLKRW